MTRDLYLVYCDIARCVYNREPISREAWERLSANPLRRMPASDIEFDTAKEREGDAQ